MIFLSFDHRVCFSEWISSGSEAICHFHTRAIARRRKAWFYLHMIRILIICSQTYWTACAWADHLLLAVICRPCGWPSANEQSIFAMELEKLIVKTSCQINISTKNISDVTETTKMNFKTVWPIVIPFSALFTNMRILKFKSQLTITFFAAVYHLNGPLRKQNFTLTGSNGHGLWFVIGWFRSVLCVSVFQGSFLVIVMMIEGREKRSCEGGFDL